MFSRFLFSVLHGAHSPVHTNFKTPKVERRSSNANLQFWGLSFRTEISHDPPALAHSGGPHTHTPCTRAPSHSRTRKWTRAWCTPTCTLTPANLMHSHTCTRHQRVPPQIGILKRPKSCPRAETCNIAGVLRLQVRINMTETFAQWLESCMGRSCQVQ